MSRTAGGGLELRRGVRKYLGEITVHDSESAKFWRSLGYRPRLPREENPEYKRKRNRDYGQRIKAEVLIHYGGGKLACVRCGFDDLRALSLDHIYGGGSTERLKKKVMYGTLRKNGYPPGYQTLCMNCQWIKRDENKEWPGY